MTICAAALCKNNQQDVLLAISDRMITSGDIEFESDRTKVFGFPPLRIACLEAGNRDYSYPIALATKKAVQHEIDDGRAPDVGEVADIYAREFVAFRRGLAERTYLSPLGLDREAFLSKHKDWNENWLSNTTERMLDVSLGVEMIITGLDGKGDPHIFTVGRLGEQEICQEICRDGRGFVAIGTGQRQFETQFMLAGYARGRQLIDALLLLMTAKRRAEVSPGVGRTSDIAIISRDFAGLITQTAITDLNRYVDDLDAGIRTAREAVLATMSTNVPLLQASIGISPLE